MNFIEEYYIDEDICDDIIVYFECSDRKTAGRAGNAVVKEKKDSIDCILENDTDLLKNYVDLLKNCSDKYKDTYKESAHTSKWVISEPINIQKYMPGSCYKAWHCERASADPVFNKRHLVFMTYLNDITDGGETEFMYQNVKFKPKKGKTLIWPVDWTHTHRGIPSMTQTKYIITGWISFVDSVQ